MAPSSPPKPRLQHKTALITGASRGIGRAIAIAFAEQGADLFLTATNRDTLAETASLATELGVEVACAPADLIEPDAVDSMFADAIGWRDGIDVLVNNAGIYAASPFTEYSRATFDHLMKINVYAVFQLMQLMLRHAQARGSGKIVNIASTAGKWESPNQAAYNASKHAVVGLTRCAALENAARGINVNAICPGMVETDMFSDFEIHARNAGVSLDEFKAGMIQSRIPMGRFLEPHEVAHIAVYLASSESDGMTGQTITISGGMRMG